MDKQKIYDLGYYLCKNGIQVIPLSPGLKYPKGLKNWQNFYFKDAQQLKRAISKGWGLGVKPNNDFCYMDLDNDHTENAYGTKILKDLPDDVLQGIYATKKNSDNLHLFFKAPRVPIKATGNGEITKGVEISSYNSQIATLPFYEFQNLDYNRGFLEQLQDCPEIIENTATILQPIDRGHVSSKHKSTSIARYLSKVEPFTEGERSSGYRRLTYLLTVKNNFDYDEVRTALYEFDKNSINFQAEEPREFEHAIRNPI